MADAYTGEIRLWTGVRVPRNWLECNGATVALQDNEPLFSLIGTTYGGNGTTNFKLPDLRGRLPIGYNQGPGLSNYAFGQSVGTETVTVTVATYPAHTHTFKATTGTATSSVPVSSTPPANTMTVADPGTANYLYAFTGQSGATTVAMGPAAITNSVGGGLAHNNIMPVGVMKYIICVYGIYPSFS